MERIHLRVLYTPVGGISSTATPLVAFKAS
jgi:hypothetical protein